MAREAGRLARPWLALAAIALAGCGGDEEGGVPAACQSPPEAILRALATAPQAVTIDGTRLSDCFAREADAADVQAVGFAFTEAASALSADVRTLHDADAALMLGYLIGAAREGAAETPGIYDELLRRLELELRGIDTRSDPFVTGEEAGRRLG